MSEYIIQPSVPTPADYVRLRTLSGLTPPPASAVSLALSNSIYCLLATTSPTSTSTSPSPGDGRGEVVGMVRLIGDGALFLQLVDVCVVPAHRGRGLGDRLVSQMCEWIDENAGEAYVSLIADPMGQGLYRKKGFVETSGIGMKRSKWGR
jgi:ribosomal protein S18 acetylase RimI-like enzyme